MMQRTWAFGLTSTIACGGLGVGCSGGSDSATPATDAGVEGGGGGTDGGQVVPDGGQVVPDGGQAAPDGGPDGQVACTFASYVIGLVNGSTNAIAMPDTTLGAGCTSSTDQADFKVLFP